MTGSLNKMLLENILPVHVADYFMGSNKKSVRILVLSCMCAHILTVMFMCSTTSIFTKLQSYKSLDYGTGQPHYNAIFGVHGNRPCYKQNSVIMRLYTIDI